MTTAIRSVATALPPRYVTGPEAYEFISSHFKLPPKQRALYRRLLVQGPLRGRHLALERNEQALEMTATQQHGRFAKWATQLATQAAMNALNAASIEPSQIDALVVNTCTGYLCPGLSSYVAQELHLNDAVQTADIMGMGCGAAIPNLRLGAGLLADGNGQAPPKRVLSVAVEVCSATMFMGSDPGLIVSNCLFSDGAAAAVLERCDHRRSKGQQQVAQLVDFESVLLPQHRDELRYRHSQGRLRNVLSRQVPQIGAAASAIVTKRLLARHKLTTADINWWIVHPGGTKVLEHIERELGLDRDALGFSYEILEQLGNLSSPSVLFVLKRLLDEGRPKAGDVGVMLSFGAGFSAFAAMVRF